jgi:beta-glucosidase
LKQIQLKAKGAQISFSNGIDLAASAEVAKKADVAIVFVQQFMYEGQDSPSLALPDDQDALVTAVAAANPRTIVVLETGGPVLMPWHNSVGAIVASWYPGIGGAQAIADVLFGNINPSGKLPVTFAASDADLPYPQVPGLARRLLTWIIWKGQWSDTNGSKPSKSSLCFRLDSVCPIQPSRSAASAYTQPRKP